MLWNLVLFSLLKRVNWVLIFFSSSSNFEMFYHHFCEFLFILIPLPITLFNTHHIFSTHFPAEWGWGWLGICKEKIDTYHYTCINISNSLLINFFSFSLEHQGICNRSRGNPHSVVQVFGDWQNNSFSSMSCLTTK